MMEPGPTDDVLLSTDEAGLYLPDLLTPGTWKSCPNTPQMFPRHHRLRSVLIIIIITMMDQVT